MDDALSGFFPLHAHVVVPLPAPRVGNAHKYYDHTLVLRSFASRSLLQNRERSQGHWAYGAALEFTVFAVERVNSPLTLGVEAGVIRELRNSYYQDHGYYGLALRWGVLGFRRIGSSHVLGNDTMDLGWWKTPDAVCARIDTGLCPGFCRSWMVLGACIIARRCIRGGRASGRSEFHVWSWCEE